MYQVQLSAEEPQESRPLLSTSVDEFLSEGGAAPPSEVSDPAASQSPLDTWEELNTGDDDDRSTFDTPPSSPHASAELLWCAPMTPESLPQSDEAVEHDLDSGSLKPVGRLTSGDLGPVDPMNASQSLEDEFVKAKAAVESDTQFWDKMQAEWEELARRKWLEEEEEGEKPSPPTNTPVRKDFPFSSDNPFTERGGAFAEAQEKVAEGHLNEAVLLLEAAILQDPQDSEAWQLLGTTQAENENERAAVASLQRCLELRPDNLQALMALAVSWTNGGLRRHACDALYGWIAHNPRYKQLLGPVAAAPPDNTNDSLFLQELLLLFQEAASLNEDHVDPQLQTGLGVLFNLAGDFQEAERAFSAALSVTPEDYLLWNRLGATLANGRRSSEAVLAYGKALQLRPGFVRCRYNLGVSCLHLGAHREAVSNFLKALKQQQRRDGGTEDDCVSASVWAALQVALADMDAPQLLRAAHDRDLDGLAAAFDVADA
ncbi:PEX5-related protein [Corythoichthys intestinalis]|uniref:PEX5-related protein n=1 Tax=Corythoichthys intestinalis TaxID=161448 RepID=UPI0025A53D8D|nr:PEX5-related protein [Corythoichthys intestinalis]